jgi:hypothetical protein
MTATTYWARLVHGNKRLDLNAEPFELAQSFSPPQVSRTVYYSEGSGRNTGGSQRVGERYADRNWTAGIRVLGDTEAEVLGYISRLASFLENARDTSSNLYFEYYPYSATGCIPLWGQGVYRYQIKDASCIVVSEWAVRDEYALVQMNMRIAPIAEGQRQRVALASGGIYEDTVKTPDGTSRGVQVCTAGTNLCTNPIFSHATWNTGWTASADLIATKISNPEYPVFGEVCAKIQNIGAAGGTALYTTTLTTAAASYMVSAYVKLLDEREPGTADMQLWCRGTALGSFLTASVGDNWYRIWDTVSCPSAAGTVGIKLMNPGAACYFDGFQMELGVNPSPLMHGDALGCAWGGTRGASSTVRSVGLLKLPVTAEIINSANSSIRMIVKWNIPTASIGSDVTLFDADGIRLYVNDPSDLQFVCGSNTLTGAYSKARDSISVIHAVWGKTSAGTKQTVLYIEGAELDSENTVDLTAYNANLYIGSTDASTETGYFTILDFTIFDRYLTAAEVAADYAQVYAHVTGGDGLGQALSRIPYIWTKDGDNVVDSYNDATHDDFAVAAGIPGNMPARTIFDMRPTFAGTADGGLMMANQVYKDYLDETNLTNLTDVAQAVGTTAVIFPSGGTTISVTRQIEAYRGRKAYMLTSLSDAGTTDARIRLICSYDTSTNAYYSDYTAIDTDGTARWYLAGPLIIPDTMPGEYDWMNGFGEINFSVDMLRATGTGTVTMDMIRLVPGDFVYIPVSGLTTNHAVIIDERRGYSYNSSTSKEDGLVSIFGGPIQLYPDQYNHLTIVPMSIARATNTADTTTISRAYVIPRYSLM